MTLCLAWRDGSDSVHLAADSRITVAKNSIEDVAVKVTRIQCELFPPSSSLKQGTGDYRVDIGMAFAGSHICAYVIKESLVEVLTRLQYVPNETEVSMDKIAKIAFFAYEALSKRVCSTSIAERGICEIFLAGYCFKSRHVRAFRFSTNPSTNTHSYAEILLAAGLEMSGSGKARAKRSPHYPSNPLRMLKDVIDDPREESVGGAIQYGKVDGDCFLIFSEYGYGPAGEPAYLRGGLDINKLIGSASYDDLFASPLIYDLSAV